MKIRLCVTLTLLCLTQVASSALAQTGQVKEDVAYGPFAAEKLDLCGADDLSHKKPGVLLIHGGGWSSGDKEGYKGLCARLAQKGFVAAEVNYRLGDKAQPETWWPAQLSDVQLAVRYLRAHADTIGLDPKRLCAWGGSAGGHLSVFLGVKDAVVPDVLAKLYQDESPKVSCVVDDFGPVDLTDPAYSGNLKLGMFAGKGPEQDPQGYRDASPIFLVSKTSAPTIIAQGYADRLVPFSQSQRLFEALNAQKVPAQFIASSGGHSEIGLLNAQKAGITDAEIAFITEQTRQLPFPPVDVTTLHHKFIVGYQGWFACPKDGGPMNAWFHWFFDNTPDAEHAHFDLLPDVSEVTAGERCPTQLKKADGSIVNLYSAQNFQSVDRHFRWMAQYGIDGAALQRFLVSIDPAKPDQHKAFDRVLNNVRVAAENNGRGFFVTYDIAGADPRTWAQLLEGDWKQLLHNDTVASPAYMHHQGKPILGIAGIGSKSRPGTAEQTAELIAALRRDSASAGGVTLLALGATNWRTLDGDSNTQAAWTSVYRSFDVMSPWTVGRYVDEGSYRHFLNQRLMPDMSEAKTLGIDYLPVIFPGFSWRHLMRLERDKDAPLNQIPRKGGAFLWLQAQGAIAAGADMIYGAMFDEVDEGTALFKLAATAQDLPLAPPLVPLDADGLTVPSDRYLELCGRISAALKGGTLMRTIPAAAPAP